MTAQLDYWIEGITDAAEDCGATLTEEQIRAIAEAVQGGHENYGQAFYSPPASDGVARIESGWKAKVDALQRELDAYRDMAESTMKRALRIHSTEQLAIESDGVYLYGGRRTQVL